MCLGHQVSRAFLQSNTTLLEMCEQKQKEGTCASPSCASPLLQHHAIESVTTKRRIKAMRSSAEEAWGRAVVLSV